MQVALGKRRKGRRCLILPGALGAAGAVCIAAATDLPGSHYGAQLGARWPFAIGGSARGWEGPRVPAWANFANNPLGPGHLLPLLAAVCGVVILGTAWVMLLRRSSRDRLRFHHLSTVLAAWVLPLFFAGPFASQDVWEYGAQGEGVLKGLASSSPAALLGHSVWLAGTDPRSAAEPALYGPASLGISAVFVRLSGGRPWLAVEYWRIVIVAALVLCAWAINRRAQRNGGNAPRAVLWGVANPGVLAIMVASIHNDAVFVAFVMAGVVLTMSGLALLAMLACAVALSFKAPAAIALLAVAWRGSSGTVRKRVLALVVAAGLAGAVLALVGLGVGGGFAWLHAGAAPSEVRSSFALFGTNPRVAGAIQLVGLVLACLLILQNRSPERWLWRLALAFLVLAMASATAQPWYLSWPLIVLAADGVSRRGDRVVAACLVGMMAWSELPQGATLWKLGFGVLWVSVVLAVSDGYVRWGSAPRPASANGQAPTSRRTEEEEDLPGTELLPLEGEP